MRRIGTDDGMFTDGNASAGVKGTLVTAAWLNAIQEEIAAAIEGFGVELNSTENDQLYNVLSGIPSLVMPSGTSMVFYQAAPPPGWTKETLDANRMVIIGNTYGYGGSDNPSAWTTGVTVNDHDDHYHAGGDHTHSMQDHYHDTALPPDGWPYSADNAVYDVLSTATGADSYSMTGRTLGSGGPSVANTGNGSADTGYVSASGAMSHTVNQSTFSPQYQIMITATKD